MKQYYDAKEQHSDALIFFRMGDFYESFGEDAKTIAQELEITLTTRGKDKDGERMPLAGIPYHAIDNYLPRLIKKGYKVAICEQLEDPEKAKGVVKRGVVRVVTPGTATDTSMFTDSSNNYLMSVSGGDGNYGVSFLDVSTGEFLTTQFADAHPDDRIASEAARMRPSGMYPASWKCILTGSSVQAEAQRASRSWYMISRKRHLMSGPLKRSLRNTSRSRPLRAWAVMACPMQYHQQALPLLMP